MFDKVYSDDEIEARAAISYALINPYDVDAVVAGWNAETASGYVFKRRSGGFTYVSRSVDGDQTVVTIRNSDDEPTHLYQRAVNWRRGQDLEELNHAIATQPKVAVTEHDGGWRKYKEKNIEEGRTATTFGVTN